MIDKKIGRLIDEGYSDDEIVRILETKADEIKLIDLEHELGRWQSVANDKEVITKRKELKKQIAALKQKLGLKEAPNKGFGKPFKNAQAKAMDYARKYRVEDKFNDFEGQYGSESDDFEYSFEKEESLDGFTLQGDYTHEVDIRDAVAALGITGEALDIITGWYEHEDAYAEDVSLEDIYEILDSTNSRDTRIVRKALESL